MSAGSKVLLLGISSSPIACKIENDDQIMCKSVMFRHISRCVLDSGVWIAVKVFRSKFISDLQGFGWGIALCELHVGQIVWVNLCHRFISIIPLAIGVVEQHTARANKLHYRRAESLLKWAAAIQRWIVGEGEDYRSEIPSPVPNEVKGLPHSKFCWLLGITDFSRS